MKRLTAITLLCLAACTGQAAAEELREWESFFREDPIVSSYAADPQPFTAEEERYVRIAKQYWHYKEHGCMRIVFASVSDFRDIESAIGSAEGSPAFTRVPWPCTLFVKRGLSPVMECLVIVHEWGHIIGREHQIVDPTGIMYTYLDPSLQYVPRCSGQPAPLNERGVVDGQSLKHRRAIPNATITGSRVIP